MADFGLCMANRISATGITGAQVYSVISTLPKSRGSLEWCQFQLELLSGYGRAGADLGMLAEVGRLDGVVCRRTHTTSKIGGDSQCWFPLWLSKGNQNGFHSGYFGLGNVREILSAISLVLGKVS